MSGATVASEIERLTAEHASLTRRQYDALQKSPYARMSKREAEAYDNRLFRIVEIRRQLAKFRTDNRTSPDAWLSGRERPASIDYGLTRRHISFGVGDQAGVKSRRQQLEDETEAAMTRMGVRSRCSPHSLRSLRTSFSI